MEPTPLQPINDWLQGLSQWWLMLTAGLDLSAPGVRWTVAWLVAFLATVWNGWDALLDLIAVYHVGRNGRIKASAIWFFRQDFVKGIACLLMLVAGIVAILRIGGTWVVDLLMFAGYLIAINQVWNRADRWRVKAAIKRAVGRDKRKESK